ncbi:peptidoglycan-binding domain-containing protein [Ancylobacter pratisalsi]|uniref:Peptidoglycan-binding protein n=1 Tax=Ancylobacter pratisalsi TaxID=1745854 RepID=A0A6P1YNP1_9HYPH|nr:peptidoglycan-binding domain-containing protein [Ancylobacter pratisalsi]QIB35077.1 peptidoglycan-binding protein [Ancylobacter pratisalsi]
MPRSYASDLLVDDIDLDGERAAGRPYRSGRRRSDVFMIVMAAAASAAVLFNALAMQDGRRSGGAPAPLAAPAELREGASAPATSAATPRPIAAPSPASTSAPVEVTPPAAPTPLAPAMPLPPTKPAAPPPRAVAAPQPSLPAPTALTPEPASPASSPRPPAEIAVSPRVMEIQKALARLGYGPIHIDGRVGEATQEAIERFERDRRLPVTGQISDRLVRELNAVAGFSIQ